MLVPPRPFRPVVTCTLAMLLAAVSGIESVPASADSSLPAVSIVSYGQWTESGSHARHLVGEVQNTGGDATVRIDLNLQSSGGATVGSAVTHTTTKVVGHGERAPFEEILQVPPLGYDHYTPAITASPSGTSPAHQFTFTLNDCPGGDPSSAACQALVSQSVISGTARNDNGYGIDTVRVIFTFYDSSGNVVAQNSTPVRNASEGATLAANETGTFSLDRTGEVGWTSFQIVAEPEYPLDTNPSTIAFGDQRVGTTSGASEVTLRNTGPATITVSALTPSTHFGTTGTCPTIASGASCRFGVTFTPADTGTQTGTLTITDLAAGSPQTIYLSGRGVAPIATLSAPPSFPDTDVGASSAAQPVTLANTGTAPLAVTTIATTGDFSQTNDCPSSLPPTNACTISVTFSPTAGGGLKQGSLVVTDDANGSPHSVALQATAIGPGVSFDVASVDFGNRVIGSSTTKPVTLTNSGNRALRIDGIAAPAGYAKSDTCPRGFLFPLAAGSSCTIQLTFAPSNPGTFNGNLVVSDNAGDSPQTIPVTGSANATVGLDQDGLTFGDQLVNTASPSQTITLINTGSDPVTITDTQVTGEFARSGGTCGGSVNAHSQCTALIGFQPMEAGAKNGTLTFTTSAGTVSATLTGNATPPTWEFLGGGLPSDAATASAGGKTDVFARGMDNSLWHRSFDAQTKMWGDWESLGGVLTSDPAAAAWGPGHLDVFVRGTDGGLWQKTFDGGNWQDWQYLGGVLTFSPGVASWGAGHLDIFVAGTHHELWQRTFDGGNTGSWGDWKLLGGVLTAEPAAVSSAPNLIDVFVRGTDNGLWQLPIVGVNPQDWISHGGGLSSAPSAASVAPGRFDVFVQGGGGSLWDRALGSGGWSWISDSFLYGGAITSDPAASARPDGTVDVIARGFDHAVWHLAIGRRIG